MYYTIDFYLFLYTKPPLAHRKLSRDVKIAELKKLKKICKAELLSDCFLVPFFYLLSPEELLVRKSYYCLNTHLQMPVVFIIYYMVYTSSSAKPNSLLTRRLAHTYLKLIFFFFKLINCMQNARHTKACNLPKYKPAVEFPQLAQEIKTEQSVLSNLLYNAIPPDFRCPNQTQRTESSFFSVTNMNVSCILYKT